MFTMRFEGGDELAAALRSVSTRLSKSILRKALFEGAEPMRVAAGAFAARRAPAPDIADNIVVAVARSDRSEAGAAGSQAAVAIGPAKGFAYGTPLEFGTVHMAAQPFMRPAFDTKAPETLGIVSTVLWRELVQRDILVNSSRADPGGAGLL